MHSAAGPLTRIFPAGLRAPGRGHAGWLPRLAFLGWLAAGRMAAAIELRPDGYHVHPGDSIQAALEMAATNAAQKVVRVHAGTYRPDSRRQALVWFNKAHAGIQLLAEGEVTLTAANPGLSRPSDPGHPAVVNHVVYFGDGVSTNTRIKGFRLTGANGFLTREDTAVLEPSRTVPRNFFFYSDGGGVKVFGRSAPRLEDLTIADNYTRPCGAGISIQQQGRRDQPVHIENCRFFTNRAQATGAAIDLLAGSTARIINCLFVGNASNLGEDMVAKNSGEKPFVNNGVVTVFWKSAALVAHCTFTGNRNGVDDLGGESLFVNNLFHANREDIGLPGHPRYELAVNAGGQVRNCALLGTVFDERKVVEGQGNRLAGPDPRFDAEFIPHAPEYEGLGYRPPRLVIVRPARPPEGPGAAAPVNAAPSPSAPR